MYNFTTIEYLKFGNERQKLAYHTLKKLGIFEQLSSYKPILTGTVPIDIDLPHSDLDIICECQDHAQFSKLLTVLFVDQDGFEIDSKTWNGIISTIARFQTENFEIEIFGQNVPTTEQYAYRHMIIEHQILNKMGTKFKDKIRKLKKDGLKTEPAFAKLLELTGNPYEELLKFQI